MGVVDCETFPLILQVQVEEVRADNVLEDCVDAVEQANDDRHELLTPHHVARLRLFLGLVVFGQVVEGFEEVEEDDQDSHLIDALWNEQNYKGGLLCLREFLLRPSVDNEHKKDPNEGRVGQKVHNYDRVLALGDPSGLPGLAVRDWHGGE